MYLDAVFWQKLSRHDNGKNNEKARNHRLFAVVTGFFEMVGVARFELSKNAVTTDVLRWWCVLGV